jgi:hypothetical protein
MNRGCCHDPISTACANCIADINSECTRLGRGKRELSDNSTADIKLITVNSLGEFYGIQAIGIEDYIKKYRQNAWRIGLDDNRLIGELNVDPGHSKTQPGEEDLRVKDLFLDQYYKSVEQKEFLGVRTASTWAERDLEIERIRSTMR